MRSQPWSVASLIGNVGLATLIAAGCNPPTSPAVTTKTENWTVQLDQDQVGVPGRIWFVVNVTLRDDPAQGTCAGNTVTTGLGTFTAPASRIQTSSLSGNLTMSWTQAGGGPCNAFSLILSPTTQNDFVVTGTQAGALLSHSGFGAVDPIVNFTGTWATGGIVRGKAYVYRTALGYLPDSHFELEMLVSEAPCNGCSGTPAAGICLYLIPQPVPGCQGGGLVYNWNGSTTIRDYLPRNTSQVDDAWYFNLVEDFDQGGPPFQVGCFRPAAGADLVQVQIVSGVASPYVSCQAGWFSTGLLTKAAGDAQSAPAGARLAVDPQVLLQGATGPVAGAQVLWSVVSGGGTVSAASIATDAAGKAAVHWTLGSALGPQTLTATAPGGGNTSVTFTATATAAVPSGGIVFVTDRDGNKEVYTVQPDGSGVANLTTNPARDDDPRWSFDRSHVVFGSERANPVLPLDLYITDAVGSAPSRLTSNATLEDEPTYSPDGVRVVYHGNTQGPDGVYVMNAAGSGVRLLQTGGDQPDWPSLGNRVVFRTPVGLSTVDANCQGTPTCPATPIPGTMPGDRSPVYSPNGQRIAFARGTGIWVMDTNGSNQVPLTSTNEDWPTWSTDGSQIAFSSQRSGCSHWHIYVMSAITGAIVRQVTGAGCAAYDDTKPNWR